MTRVIKFKAWDTKRKEMIPFCEREYWETRRYGKHASIEPSAFGCGIYFIRSGQEYAADEGQDYLLLQYIGLKDKNDTEIYEGDIVIQLTSYEKREERCVIKSDGSWFVGSAYASTEWQVIGNIYENPELLEDTT